MDSDFPELYRKLTSNRAVPEAAIATLPEIAALCRAHKSTAGTDNKLPPYADHCFHEIVISLPLFTSAIAQWLTSDEDFELGSALLSKANGEYLDAKSPLSFDLEQVKENMAILAGCRLAAEFSTPAISLGWTLSLLAARPTSELTQNAVTSLLGYHLDEFPITSKKLLTVPSPEFESLDLFQLARAEIQKRAQFINSLPFVNEFAMTPEMHMRLVAIRRQENREILRSANDTSFFAKLFSTHHFKYSNKTSVEIHHADGIEETTLDMATHSVSMELPLSERTDPMFGTKLRYALWQGHLK
ncbi:hypothetical protein PQR63_19480 [Herbaspirillum rhizosphaerae]|uniref:Immunity protein 49 of polymorphic toxin system n=1 Tax=Herbaspirillum rhizosphaerae TaxID=346179 RepID=A0ABW8ZBR6_9BURK